MIRLQVVHLGPFCVSPERPTVGFGWSVSPDSRSRNAKSSVLSALFFDGAGGGFGSISMISACAPDSLILGETGLISETDLAGVISADLASAAAALGTSLLPCSAAGFDWSHTKKLQKLTSVTDLAMLPICSGIGK